MIIFTLRRILLLIVTLFLLTFVGNTAKYTFSSIFLHPCSPFFPKQ